MKFNEALEHFRNNTDISGTAVFLDDVEDTLKELCEEYTPTIELTKKQKGRFYNAKDKKNFHGFLSHYRMNSNGQLSKFTEEELMKAWLYPETIKIVDK